MVVRLVRNDMNMPDFEGFAIERQVSEVLFEAAVYNLLHDKHEIRMSRLLYYRVLVQDVGPRTEVLSDISGRRMLVFERSDGTNNVWEQLNAENQVYTDLIFGSDILTFASSGFSINSHVCVLPCSITVRHSTLLRDTCTAASSISNQMFSPNPLLSHAGFGCMF
jgi:hypothetical protein